MASRASSDERRPGSRYPRRTDVRTAPRAARSPATVVVDTPRSATAIPTTPENPRAIPTAVIRLTRSFNRKWETSATITGWEVTRTTELATVTPAVLREVIQSAKWAAR